MIVFLNGKFVPEEKAVVSVFDRGFLFGDGLFEAMLVRRGEIFRWDQHLERLQRGIEFLKLTVPWSAEELFRFSMQLIQRNRMPECLLRINISRGITARGYSPKNAIRPALVLTLHPLPALDAKGPPRWRIITSSFCLPARDPLTRFKTANKLPEVMARAEADSAGAHDAILLNPRGFIAEATSANVFWIRHDVVCTTPLPSGALPGITRSTVLELCRKRNIAWREKNAKPDDLRRAQGIFLTNTSMGVIEVESLDKRKLQRSPLVRKLWAAYRELL
jgi:aminodeoxychorismate lyase